MTDAELKALAERATPGPWKFYSGKLRPNYPTPIQEIHDHTGNVIVKWGGFDGLDITQKTNMANGAFIAACNPQTILSLLAENERLRAALKEP